MNLIQKLASEPENMINEEQLTEKIRSELDVEIKETLKTIDQFTKELEKNVKEGRIRRALMAYSTIESANQELALINRFYQYITNSFYDGD